MLTDETIAEIRERESKARPGPWTVEDNHPGHEGYLHVRGDGHAVCGLGDMEEVEAQELYDGEFIANSRQDVPDLLDEIDRLRERVRVLESEAGKDLQRAVNWKEAARLSAQGNDYWRERTVKAEAEVARLRDEDETLQRQWRELKEDMSHDD